MTCTNKLKQLALASMNAHDVRGHFPSAAVQPEYHQINIGLGVVDPAGNGETAPIGRSGAWAVRGRIAWTIPLLPFIEQQAIYAPINALATAAPIAGGTTQNTTYPQCYSYTNAATYDNLAGNNAAPNPYAVMIDAYQCPSELVKKPGNGSLGILSYHGNRGDDTNYNTTWTDIPRGVFGRGDLFRGTIAEIVDGTSNTVMFAEVCIGEYGTTQNSILGGTANVGNPEGSGFILNCLNQRGAGGKLNTPRGTQMGCRWSDAYASYGLFHTVLPPNSPSCGANNAEQMMVSASSYHSGGANAAFVDGSVRFISETINALSTGTNLTGLTVTRTSETGESKFGVWGALGSRNGGESKSL